ncbi:MAG: AbrB family transcriptional regulator [Pseudomonadota bacterium]
MQWNPAAASIRTHALTLAISVAGAVLFSAAGLPLPLLLGPMFACLAAALAGLNLYALKGVSEAMRTILGIAVGASLTPGLIDRAGGMALSLALVPLFVLIIGLVGYPYFRRFCGFDRVTAYYAAMPGGLQDMILFGQEAGGNVRSLALVHATRVLVIVSIMPLLLAFLFGMGLDNPPGAPVLEIPWHALALMLAAAWIGWRGGKRVGLFGAAILGPMAVSGALALGGVLEHRPPAEAVWAAQFFIGMGVGVSYIGTTIEEVRRILLASLGYCLILAVLSLIFAEGVFLTGAAPQVEALLAFAPGGQAEMVVLAIVAGVDMAFVVTHHLTRLIVVIIGAPLAARWLR